ESGMEIRGGNPGLQHRHRIGTQEMIQPVADLARLELLLQIEMRHLAQGMHAGIGAARTGDRHPFAGKLLDRIFQRTLHRRSVVLALPAYKRRAVIFQREAEAAHQPSRVPGGKAKPLSNSRASITPLPARWTFKS